ncbi:MAG: SAM-dependent methyltransferase, partial [Coriobacteriaceae bacterium]|nr:SAM-dependent methyltransferase [Coriobacteriaceae bacterium]
TAGAPVEVLPGPTATATAYVASGFTCPRFYFGGFFPRKEGQRAEILAALQSLDAVLLFYESPHRIVAALRAVVESMPYRQVAVCRELTKLHEEVAIGTAQELAEAFAEREAAGGVKGEIVLVIDAPSEQEHACKAQDAREGASDRAAQLAAEGMRAKQISKQLAAEFGLSRNEAYDMALAASKQARAE